MLQERSRFRSPAKIQEIEFAPDSPLEESGFEPLVPLATEMLIECIPLPKIHRVCPRLNRPSSPPGDEAPNEQDNHRAHDGSDEPGSLIGAVPADCLPQIGRDKGSGYSEQRCQNKSGRLVVSGRA
jgi:hypothetical protein